jgi:F-type H+-transporting ATPase subunit b
MNHSRLAIRFALSLGFVALTLFLLIPGQASALHLSAVAVQEQPSSTQAALAEESREAAGEQKDETAQFKHSDSVLWLAKLTGMSLDHAYMLGVGLNFAVLAGAILWFSKKGLPKVFRARTVSIQSALEEARKVSEEARTRLTEIESRLSRLGSEIAEMRASAEHEAAAEEERIKTAAAEDAKRIVASAEQEIAAVAKAARRELTRHAADLAVSLAQKQMKLDLPTDQRLLHNFVEQLSNGGPKGQK